MAEPFAAAVFADEEKAKQQPEPFEIDLAAYKPAWATGHVVQGANDIAKMEAENTGFIETTRRAIYSGDNFGVQVWKDLERIHAAGPEDPEWQNQKTDWIKQNRKRIPIDDDWRYNQVNNRVEAETLLADSESNAREQYQLSQRGGFSTYVARGVAGLLDVDTPIAMMTGGLSASAKIGINATRIGRLATGAASGALTASAAAAAGYSSDPNSDWTVIPTAGLMGAIFGGAVGMSSRAPVALADGARIKALDEFGETVNDGVPRAAEDPRFESFENTDPYGSAATNRVEMKVAEVAIEDPPHRSLKLSTTLDGDIDIAAIKENVPNVGGIYDSVDAYHGTPVEFDNFDRAKLSSRTSGPGSEVGFFFTSSEAIAKTYTKDSIGNKIVDKLVGNEPMKEAGNIKKVKIKFTNPYVIDMKGKTLRNDALGDQIDTLQHLIASRTGEFAQYDGVVLKNVKDSGSLSLKRAPVSDVFFAPFESRFGQKTVDSTEVKPTAIDIDKITEDVVPDHELPEGRSSIGARQLGNTGPGVASIRNTRIQTMVQDAKTWAAQSGVPTEWLDGWGNLTGKKAAIGRQAERFHNFLSQGPLGSDYAKMMNSGSAVAQRFAYDMMENASGIIRNARSGARLLDHYQKGMLADFSKFQDEYASWAGSVKGMGFMRREWDVSTRAEFNRAVTEEMQARMYDGIGKPNQHPNIRAAADALDATFAKEAEIMKGRPNEMSVAGAQHLKQQSGYMPQKWLGRNMLNLINTGQATRVQIVDAIAEGYTNLHPNIKPKDAQIYADAVVGRAEKFDQGINTNLIGMLAGDGRVELQDLLTRQGNLSAHEIDQFIDRLTGAMEVKGSPGQTKARLDIDLRYTASNGVKIMDLVDTDFASMVPKRVRRSAGQAALARKGIASRADFQAFKDAVIAEQTANGKSAPTGTSLMDRARDALDSDKHVDMDFLDNLYSYFNGDPIAGGISPVYSRMKKLTNLALLNQLGLTQLAEFGVTIASVGIQQFYRHAGNEIRDSLAKVDSPLVQELKHMNIFIPEEKLFRDDLVHEFEKQTSTSEYMRNFDRLLNKAQRVQGFTSGFYHMRKIQQRIAVTTAADKLARHFKNGGVISDPRLQDMGLNRMEILSLKQYVNTGVVKFDADGNLQSLNFSQWAPEDVELFALTLNASTNTLVQKAMVGESSMLFHKDGVASLFWHLKSFPMLAIEKQLLRQSRIMDTETAMTFMYGLGTASAAYTARQVINGRPQNLTFDKIARGAFGYSNMTGWIPMWTDPLAGMLGMDNLKIGGYGGYGGNQVISTPAAFGTLDRMVQAPAAAIHSVLNLGPTKADINALTATPLIGNAYGFAFMFNQLR